MKLRLSKKYKEKGQIFQDIFINCANFRYEIRKGRSREEIKAGNVNLSFNGMDEYLRKYHGFKNFEMLEHERKGKEFRLKIRYIGLIEKLKKRISGWLS